MNFKALSFIALLSLPLVAQEAPKPQGVSLEMQDEVDRLNRFPGAKNWVAGTNNEILVYFDPAMSWTIQAKMYRKSVAKTFREKGVAQVVVWNGKSAWIGSTTEDGQMVELKGPVPVPSINQSYLNLPGVEAQLKAYNKGK